MVRRIACAGQRGGGVGPSSPGLAGLLGLSPRAPSRPVFASTATSELGTGGSAPSDPLRRSRARERRSPTGGGSSRVAPPVFAWHATLTRVPIVLRREQTAWPHSTQRSGRYEHAHVQRWSSGRPQASQVILQRQPRRSANPLSQSFATIVCRNPLRRGAERAPLNFYPTGNRPVASKTARARRP